MDACPDQIDLFKETFPEGTEITKESIEKAANAELDLYWFILQIKPNEVKEVEKRYHILLKKAYEWRISGDRFRYNEYNEILNNMITSLGQSFDKAIDYLLLSI